MSEFVSHANALSLMTAIANKIAGIDTGAGAYRFRGSVTFANLPATITRTMDGFVYNVTNDFTTDARFIEGAGKKYKAGTNVAVADLSVDNYNAVTPVGSENPKTEGWYERSGSDPDYVYTLTTDETVDAGKTYYAKTTTVNVKFDVVGSFYDLDAIYDLIAGEFSDIVPYDTGDVVLYDGEIYKFKADHAAGAWDPTEADKKTIAELIAEAEPDELTTAQVNALIALLD